MFSSWVFAFSAFNSICIHSLTTIIRLSLFIALSPRDIHCLRHSSLILLGFASLLKAVAISVATGYSHTFYHAYHLKRQEWSRELTLRPFVRTPFTRNHSKRNIFISFVPFGVANVLLCKCKINLRLSRLNRDCHCGNSWPVCVCLCVGECKTVSETNKMLCHICLLVNTRDRKAKTIKLEFRGRKIYISYSYVQKDETQTLTMLLSLFCHLL